jgi:hypothetical protein
MAAKWELARYEVIVITYPLMKRSARHRVPAARRGRRDPVDPRGVELRPGRRSRSEKGTGEEALCAVSTVELLVWLVRKGRADVWPNPLRGGGVAEQSRLAIGDQRVHPRSR